MSSLVSIVTSEEEFTMATWALKDVPTILSRFIEHWEALDSALAPKPLVLRGGYSVALLTEDRTVFEESEQAIVDAENTTQTSSSRRKALRESLRERIRQFRAAILGDFADTEFASALPTIPLQTASDAAWTKALHSVATPTPSLSQTLPPSPPPPTT